LYVALLVNKCHVYYEREIEIVFVRLETLDNVYKYSQAVVDS